MTTKSSCSRLFVAAIDFGTTYSGFAFSPKSDWAKVKYPKWAGGTMMSYKAPTAILLNSDQSFNSFGYDAEKIYIDLAGEGDHEEYFYFRRFKMKLKENQIHRHVVIEDVTGKTLEAMRVFSLCIEHLRKEIIKEMNQGLTVDIKQKDIQFVLTVPAIWNDTAKMFMREAAIDAGIESDQLLIALEPEAASIYCQHLHLERDTKDDAFMKAVDAGTKYMVVDLGGGTADITVHKKLSDGTLEELIPASGGDWGGTSVDKSFEIFMLNLIGKDTMAKFKEENMEDFIQLFNDFETKKRGVLASKIGHIHMTIPLALITLLKEVHKTKDKKECMQKVFQTSTYTQKDQISFDNNKLKMPADIFKGFFTPTSDKIVQHIKKLFKENNFSDVRIILMVGGFSESNIIQETISQQFGPQAKSESFGGRRIVIPEESGLAVLKGAVYFGHVPNAISRRVSRFTYGIQSYPEYNPSRHPSEKKVTIDGVPRCKDVFFIYVRKGEQIKPGLSHSQVFQALKPKENKLECAVYISDDPNPEYIDGPKCKRLGVLTVELPSRRDGEILELEESMIFGETELRVKARDIFTHAEKEIKFDLLDEKNLIDK